jgi:hypothetical protein
VLTRLYLYYLYIGLHKVKKGHHLRDLFLIYYANLLCLKKIVTHFSIFTFLSSPFLAYFLYFEKIKVALCDLESLCVSQYPPYHLFNP